MAVLWKTFRFITPWQIIEINVLTLIEIFVTEWNKKSLWKLNPCECGLFSRSQWPYSLHIFSLVSLVKKCATCKAIVTFQRGPIHTESTFTVFFFHSLTYITINVRHIHFLEKTLLNLKVSWQWQQVFDILYNLQKQNSPVYVAWGIIMYFMIFK